MALFYEPGSAKLERLIEDATLSTGPTIQIPNLQRAYVWRPDEVILLLDSLIKGWPFGSLLLWAVEPRNLPNRDMPTMPRRSFWQVASRVDLSPSKEVTAAVGNLAGYRMVLDGQQRLQSLILGLKGTGYGFRLYDYVWARSLELPPRKETAHWSRGCLCVDLMALGNQLLHHNQIIEYVDFRNVLSWVVIDQYLDLYPGINAQQKSPLPIWQLGDALIPLSEFWAASVVTHVRPSDKYKSVIASLFHIYNVNDPELIGVAERLLDKLDELKRTDVQYLEVLPFSAAFDLDEYNDAVINIFTRLNSTGRRLEPEEITFAWIKMNWTPSAENGNREADKCFEELREQLYLQAELSMDLIEIVRGMSAVWATLFANGELLRERDLLNAVKLRPMANQLAGQWNILTQAVHRMSERISDLGFERRDTYNSLNSLFVLWALESVVVTWNVRDRMRLPDADAFLERYEDLVSKFIDRWFLMSQWAGTWSQTDETELSRNFLVLLTKMKMELWSTSDGTRAVTLIQDLLNRWIDSFRPKAKVFIENLNANTRASVRQYKGPLWIWNRLKADRYELSKIPLREFHKRKGKLLEVEVDHIVAVKFWETDTNGTSTPEETARVLNSIGNCLLLEKTFNISKSSQPAYEFFCKVNYFRRGHDASGRIDDTIDSNKFVELSREFRLPGSLLRPRNRKKQRLSTLILKRERWIKKELTDYIDGRLNRKGY